MEAGLYYKERLDHLNEILNELVKKESGFGLLRIAATVILLAGIYIFWGSSLLTILIAALIFSVLFLLILRAESKNKSASFHTRQLIAINEDEVKALDH